MRQKVSSEALFLRSVSHSQLGLICDDMITKEEEEEEEAERSLG